MKTYRGYRFGGRTFVTVEEYGYTAELSPGPSMLVVNHTHGFEWGFAGDGPAQLALALILDASGLPGRARANYQVLKQLVVRDWGDGWTITDRQILDWLDGKPGAQTGLKTPQVQKGGAA
ncbi:MAG: hypothetical protein JWO38_4901 [Gemmataceae bacterium]|nr:hypothetical protein [Gemmataceae bacterium]